MKCNIYDFDKTIYKGDSSIDFYLYSLRKHFFKVFPFFPKQIKALFCYMLKKIDKTTFKSEFFSFISNLNVKQEVENFWKKKKERIYHWYLGQKKESDIIISASPEFLVVPICKTLGISSILATKMDIHTGKIIGANCHGQEKVNRLIQKLPKVKAVNFYSDSLSDTPLAKIADHAFLIKKGKITSWPKM